MRKIYCIVLLCMLAYSVQSQNTGYAGKRFLVKATVLSGVRNPLTQLELECAVSRKVTVSLGFKMNSVTLNQWYYDGEYATDYNPYESPFKTENGFPSITEKATIDTKMAGLEFRYYFKSYSLPAPRGVYGYFNLYIGTAHISNGVYYESLYTDLYNWNYFMGGPVFFPDQKHTYSVNATTTTIDFGWGYQEMVTSRISLELKGGFSYGSLVASEPKSQKAVSGAVKNYGSNLFAIRSKSMTDLGGTVSPRTGSFGMSVYATVGFLLF